MLARLRRHSSSARQLRLFSEGATYVWFLWLVAALLAAPSVLAPPAISLSCRCVGNVGAVGLRLCPFRSPRGWKLHQRPLALGALDAKSEKEALEVFDLPAGSSRKEIKARYRELAIKLHPDRNPDDPAAIEKFRRILTSYKVLVESTARSIDELDGVSAGEPDYYRDFGLDKLDLKEEEFLNSFESLPGFEEFRERPDSPQGPATATSGPPRQAPGRSSEPSAGPTRKTQGRSSAASESRPRRPRSRASASARKRVPADPDRRQMLEIAAASAAGVVVGSAWFGLQPLAPPPDNETALGTADDASASKRNVRLVSEETRRDIFAYVDEFGRNDLLDASPDKLAMEFGVSRGGHVTKDDFEVLRRWFREAILSKWRMSYSDYVRN